MTSRLVDVKAKARALRSNGASYKKIRDELGVPLSTLNGWLRDIQLTNEQKKKLNEQWRQGLVRARTKASETHRQNRLKRIQQIHQKVDYDYGRVSLKPHQEEIALAMLYLGEGSKTKRGLGLGNSDSKILRFYIGALKRLYGVNASTLRAELHLRADQDEEAMKDFWARELSLMKHQFRYVIKDPRTIGKPTYEGYKGVCLLNGGGVEIQRRLMYLAEVLCSRS